MKIDFRAPFKNRPGDPAPLSLSLRRKIRFGECDPMGLVWHGHYPVFFEEAREALAGKCGISFNILKEARLLLPVKTMCADYCAPLYYDHEYNVEAAMHWTDAARINMTYKISGLDGQLCTRAFSVQLMVDLEGRLVLDPPLFYRHFLDKWFAGTLPAFSASRIDAA